MKRNIHKYFHYRLWISSSDRQKMQREKITFPGRFERIKKKNECVVQVYRSLAEESKQEGVFLIYPL